MLKKQCQFLGLIRIFDLLGRVFSEKNLLHFCSPDHARHFRNWFRGGCSRLNASILKVPAEFTGFTRFFPVLPVFPVETWFLFSAKICGIVFCSFPNFFRFLSFSLSFFLWDRSAGYFPIFYKYGEIKRGDFSILTRLKWF